MTCECDGGWILRRDPTAAVSRSHPPQGPRRLSNACAARSRGARTTERGHLSARSSKCFVTARHTCMTESDENLIIRYKYLTLNLGCTWDALVQWCSHKVMQNRGGDSEPSEIAAWQSLPPRYAAGVRSRGGVKIPKCIPSASQMHPECRGFFGPSIRSPPPFCLGG